jgi:DNA-binding response OmpR family regulator
MKSRAHHSVVVCEAHSGHGDAVAEKLAQSGYDVRRCTDEMSLIETSVASRPRAIVYELHHELPVDLAVLSLVRRVLPHIPLVVVAGALAEHAIRVLRAIDPTVLAHEPVDRAELIAAVRSAMRRSRVSERRERALLAV